MFVGAGLRPALFLITRLPLSVYFVEAFYCCLAAALDRLMSLLCLLELAFGQLFFDHTLASVCVLC